MLNSSWFRFIYTGVFVLFMGIMTYVTYLAYRHPSHSTNIDIAKIQQVRYKALMSTKTENKRPWIVNR